MKKMLFTLGLLMITGACLAGQGAFPDQHHGRSATMSSFVIGSADASPSSSTPQPAPATGQFGMHPS